MSSILQLGRFKGTGIILRLIVIMALVLSTFGLIMQPAMAAASIDQIRSPAPPQYVLNTGSSTELIWWEITYESTLTPNRMVYRLYDPDNIRIDSNYTATTGITWPDQNRTYQIPGDLTLQPVNNGTTFSVFNVENTVGQAEHGNALHNSFAHQLPIPLGAKPGVYSSYVDFYSSVGLDSSSMITFNVKQPVTIFKYNDLDGNGHWLDVNGNWAADAGDEPGLDDWHFVITRPYSGTVAASPAPTVNDFTGSGLTAGFPIAGEHLAINGVDVGVYSLEAGVFTLATAMGSAPTAGQTISIYPMTGDTSGGGYIDLLLENEGYYNITETLQSGWGNTDPGGVAPYTKTIQPSTLDLTHPIVVFGNQELANLEVFKFNDLDKDGVYDPGDGETGLSGWSFSITDTGSYSSSGVTNSSGLITKTDLVPGSYTVTETPKSGWTNSTELVQTKAVVIGSTVRYSFGNYQPLGTLVVFKFNDLNGNSVYDPGLGETPLENWHYTITGPGYLSTGYTDASGLITKTELNPGNYTVTETTRTGWTITTSNNQLKAVTADNVTRYDFGNQQVEIRVPVTSGTGLWIMIGGFAGAMALFMYWRTRRSLR